MVRNISINFCSVHEMGPNVIIALIDSERVLGDRTAQLIPDGLLTRAAEVSKFSGKSLSTLDLIAPENTQATRLIFVCTGETAKMEACDWLKLGGKIAAVALSSKSEAVSVLAERPDNIEFDPKTLAILASGIKLRAYHFDRYKTITRGDKKEGGPLAIALHTKNAEAATAAWALEEGVVDGQLLARTLVNEPANILGPVEFADHASNLEKLGIDVEILTEKEMSALKMGALLGVAQGSVRPPRLAVMKWMGGKQGEKPVAFIGKGVVFDSGGISLKPGGGMEDMKGDMAGAAAVIGLMHALASRKARVNVIGVLGLVENMPDGNAQRPGDIVTSMSGQTIEIINTDAEGRLVLCDALHYVNSTYEPRFMVNLATLTGAIIVALGNHHAGLFSNDDALSEALTKAGITTGEALWRLPLSKDYDKLINSKFADMKNTGSRAAGSITAAQFLQRFVGETPWAHLDIAGVAFSAPQTDINKSWASGYGVRLLDCLVQDYCETEA